MTNSSNLTLVLLFSLSMHVLSAESDVEEFTELKQNGILNPSVPDVHVIEMIEEGIQSTNDQIVKLSIQSLGRYADFLILGAEGPFGPIPVRSFEDEIRLKNFLIGHWETEHARSGYNATRQLENDFESIKSDRQTLLSSTSTGNESIEKLDLESYWDYAQDRISPWLEIPRMLCLFWPGDDDVHTLIWEYYEYDRNVAATSMLSLLNYGKFSTREANEYRMNQLVTYKIEEGLVADLAISMAAKGLAFSHPEEAISNLIRAGYDHINPRSDILITLSGYTDSQLKPYYNKLVSLVSVGKPDGPINQELQEALNRLIPYTKGRRPLFD